MERILVTGCAGFIGFHVAKRLVEEGHEVFGLDNLNKYYDVRLKKARLSKLADHHHFQFIKMDLNDREGMAQLFHDVNFGKIVHLAAQAGVRYSLTNPHAYVDANLVGFLNILEGCRDNDVKHLVFASSSSVYGVNSKMPFSEQDNVDRPVSLYAATKKANELMAHAYAHLYRLPCTGLRFFTVYGPWGRPDMALFLFTKRILKDEPIDVFNHGKMRRDFTYIDDVVEGVVRILGRIPRPSAARSRERSDCSTRSIPYRIYNIGNNKPIELNKLIAILEAKLGKRAKLNLVPLQPGDVRATYADVDSLARAVGFKPRTPIEEGIGRFVEWYREYHGIAPKTPSV